MVYFKYYLDKQLQKLVPYTDAHRWQLQETFKFWEMKINPPDSANYSSDPIAENRYSLKQDCYSLENISCVAVKFVSYAFAKCSLKMT